MPEPDPEPTTPEPTTPSRPDSEAELVDELEHKVESEKDGLDQDPDAAGPDTTESDTGASEPPD